MGNVLDARRFDEHGETTTVAVHNKTANGVNGWVHFYMDTTAGAVSLRFSHFYSFIFACLSSGRYDYAAVQ